MPIIQNAIQNGACDAWWNRTPLSSKAAPFISCKVVSEDKSPRPLSESSEPEPSTASSDHGKEETNLSSSDSETEHEEGTQDVSRDSVVDLDVGGEGAGLSGQGSGLSGQTTIVMQHIPNEYTQSQLMDEINSSGFDGTYDFFYLPNTARRARNRGFVFINFLSAAFAELFYSKYNGQKLQHFEATAPLTLRPADVQGFEESAERFSAKNSWKKEKNLSEPVFLPVKIRIKEEAMCQGNTRDSKGTVQKKKKKSQESHTSAHKVHYMPAQLEAFTGDALGPLLAPGLPPPAMPMPPPPRFCQSCGGARGVGHAFCPYCGVLLHF